MSGYSPATEKAQAQMEETADIQHLANELCRRLAEVLNRMVDDYRAALAEAQVNQDGEVD